MQRETQIKLMRKAFAHIEAGTTDATAAMFRYPNEVYYSPEWLARETEILFRKFPLMVGLSSAIPNAGDHFTDDHTGVPILVARGEDGKVRAFLNVCRHRGSRLTDGCGNHRSFVCPYHGWTYALDGRLRAIPDHRNFPDIKPAEHGLVPLPVAERHGMIWVRPQVDPHGENNLDIAGHLGGLDAEMASYKLETYHFYETREIHRKTNWKLIMDTFLEPYHFAVLHQKTVAKIFVGNLCLFEPFGYHLREVFARHTIAVQREAPESEWDFIKHSTIVYILFPNTVVITQLDHVEMWRLFPVPGKVDECVMYLDFIVPNPIETESARQHWKRSMDLTVATVIQEDFPMAEGIQRGVRSGAQTHMWVGRNEPAVAHFQRSIREVVSSPPPA